MPEDIQKYSQLTVVSDTALFRKGNTTFGFGPVVRELEYISPMFEKIVWIGFERSDEIGSRAFDRVTADNIETVLLKKCGGNRFVDKLNVLLNTPQMVLVILKHIIKAEVIHTRAPSAPAFIAVLLSYIFKKKIWWNKYAGNWVQKNPPFFYGIQRKLFMAAKHTNVTINGFWSDQPKHCLSFENPCLTNEQIVKGKRVQSQKKFNAPFHLAFVGRLEDEKGVVRIIEALKNVDMDLLDRIDFIGNGPNKNEYERQSLFMGEKVIFHGYLDNSGVHEILSKAHFFLLPSTASEGFPKVIAEAACYGCIPVVSNVSCIGHYVKNKTNGFLWKTDGNDSFTEVLGKALIAPLKELEPKSENILLLAEKFTFDNYRRKLETSVLT